ncbi:MAG: C-GCAxxG-C-C family protein [Spirochaetales bacterium]
MTKSEQAIAKFNEGFNCAQSVFYPFHEELGLDETLALKLASGFGGGMGRMQEVCGAVSGGVLALGTAFGPTNPEDRDARKKTYALVQEFFRQFVSQHGHCTCRDLLKGIDLNTEEGQRQFEAQNLRHLVCIPCVKTAVEVVEGMLAKG